MGVLMELRQKSGLNKSQMAHRLRICKSYYTMLEKGDREISRSVAIRIHEEFSVPLEELLLGPPVNEPRTKGFSSLEKVG